MSNSASPPCRTSVPPYRYPKLSLSINYFAWGYTLCTGHDFIAFIISNRCPSPQSRSRSGIDCQFRIVVPPPRRPFEPTFKECIYAL